MRRICSIKGCHRDHVARGWCSLHYRRWYNNGDPLYNYWDQFPKVCGVPDCEGRVESYGLCHKHYFRIRRAGLTPSVENYKQWELEKAREILERWGQPIPDEVAA